MRIAVITMRITEIMMNIMMMIDDDNKDVVFLMVMMWIMIMLKVNVVFEWLW